MRVLIKDEDDILRVIEAVDIYYIDEIAKGCNGLYIVPLRTDYLDIFIPNIDKYTSNNICNLLLEKEFVDLSMYSYKTIPEDEEDKYI